MLWRCAPVVVLRPGGCSAAWWCAIRCRFAAWWCTPVIVLLPGGRFAASRNTRISLPYHRRGGVMHRGLKTHCVPQEGVFGTEYLSRTVEAYFEHRVPLKTRRVPQEPFYGTARRFCTGEAPFRYRISQTDTRCIVWWLLRRAIR